MINVRELALGVLRDWDRSADKYAQDLLESTFRTHTSLSPEDKALMYELVVGVLRRLRLLDYWIDNYRKGALEDDLRRILRLGFYQLFFSRIPAHAAVHETVNLAPKRSRGLINAILRTAEREKEEILSELTSLPAGIRYSLPDFLLSQWEEQWGKKLTQELARQAERVPTHHVRLNRLHPDFLVTRERCLKELAPLEGREDVFRVDKVPYELLKSGAAYLQDPSTLRACELLAPLPGERVLDACASPGGKTAYLAQMMNDSGKIIAVDLTDKRVERLKENLDRLCVTNAEVHKWDWRQKDSHRKAFDRILVDVPCSNTGVINRRVDVRWRLQKGTSKSMSAEQRRLLSKMIPLLNDGGSVVYSTCSIDREENEVVVRDVLRQFPEMTLVESIQLFPERSDHDGAYAALLKKRR